MMRIRFSCYLTFFLVGLLWLGCDIPALLENLGDEVRLTNDLQLNLSPFWYETPQPINSLDGGIVGFHDKESIYLYYCDSKANEIVYSAPDGWEVTSLDRVVSFGGDSYITDYAFSVFNGSEFIIYANLDGSLSEIYRSEGSEVVSIIAYNDILGDRTDLRMYFSTNNEIYHLYYDRSIDELVFCTFIINGYQLTYDYQFDYHLVIFTRENAFNSSIYRCFVNDDGSLQGFGLFAEDSILQGTNISYLSTDFWNNVFAVSDYGGEINMWNVPLGLRITNDEGEERGMDTVSDLTVFERVVDNQSDLYVVRSFVFHY
ncbi:hypothetical protein KAU45_00365 [bacterium]|nr:hypothetical protein [bacterium]